MDGWVEMDDIERAVSIERIETDVEDFIIFVSRLKTPFDRMGHFSFHRRRKLFRHGQVRILPGLPFTRKWYTIEDQ